MRTSLQCEAGVTPNPDLACNRHIKFGALLEHCKSLGADVVATGHYARIERCADSGQLQLLRGVDPLKDQSYFLASIHGSCLAGETLPSTELAQGSCCSWLPVTVQKLIIDCRHSGSYCFEVCEWKLHW